MMDQIPPDTDDTPPAFTPREQAMIAEAERDIAAGRTIPWETVKARMESWGNVKDLPPPRRRA